MRHNMQPAYTSLGILIRQDKKRLTREKIILFPRQAMAPQDMIKIEAELRIY